jgi:hypothetical protein
MDFPVAPDASMLPPPPAEWFDGGNKIPASNKMKWIDALKEWNGKRGGSWCVPRKGTPEYDEVKALMQPAENEKPNLGTEEMMDMLENKTPGWEKVYKWGAKEFNVDKFTFPFVNENGRKFQTPLDYIWRQLLLVLRREEREAKEKEEKTNPVQAPKYVQPEEKRYTAEEVPNLSLREKARILARYSPSNPAYKAVVKYAENKYLVAGTEIPTVIRNKMLKQGSYSPGVETNYAINKLIDEYRKQNAKLKNPDKSF